MIYTCFKKYQIPPCLCFLHSFHYSPVPMNNKLKTDTKTSVVIFMFQASGKYRIQSKGLEKIYGADCSKSV